MNILPLILALVFMLAVLTIEKLEKFKNSSIVQKEYQHYLLMSERVVFNHRQELLGHWGYDKDVKQLSVRYLFDKNARDRNLNEAKQYRLLLTELMKIVYGEAAFYKEIESRRPKFLDEMLSAIEKVTEDSEKKLVKQAKDLAQLDLKDPELQNAFYHMLKGTMPREEWKKMVDPTPRKASKAYPSLLAYININGKDESPTIRVAQCPREVLKAIFVSDEVVEAIIEKRMTLGGKGRDSGNNEAFKREFMNKRRPGIDEKLLNFKLADQPSPVYD